MKNQEGIFIVGRGKFDPMQLTNKSKKTFELDSTEFEALIQLDVACSHWANAPEAIRWLFGLFDDND